MLKLSSLSPSSDLDRMLLMWWNTLLWCRNWWSDCLNLRLQHLVKQQKVFRDCICISVFFTHVYMRLLDCYRLLMVFLCRGRRYLRAICWSELPLGRDIIRSEMVWSRRWKVWGSGWAASPAMMMSDRGCSQTPKSFSCKKEENCPMSGTAFHHKCTVTLINKPLEVLSSGRTCSRFSLFPLFSSSSSSSVSKGDGVRDATKCHRISWREVVWVTLHSSQLKA